MTTLTIDQALALHAALNGKQDTASPPSSDPIGVIGRPVIVRSRDAGVIYGKYVGNDGSTVHLKDGIQMWKWFAAKGHTLIDVATYGVKKSECKFSPASATVTVFNACALIDVTNDAACSIEAAQ